MFIECEIFIDATNVVYMFIECEIFIDADSQSSNRFKKM